MKQNTVTKVGTFLFCQKYQWCFTRDATGLDNINLVICLNDLPITGSVSCRYNYLAFLSTQSSVKFGFKKMSIRYVQKYNYNKLEWKILFQRIVRQNSLGTYLKLVAYENLGSWPVLLNNTKMPNNICPTLLPLNLL